MFKIARLVAISAALWLILLCLIAAGCSAQEARKNADRLDAAAESSLIYKAKLDAILEAAKAGAISGDAAIEALRQVLSPEDSTKLDRAVAIGGEALTRAEEISRAIGLSAEAAKRKAAEFRESIASLEASDSATAQGLSAIVGGIAPIFGPWGLVVAGIASTISAVVGRRSGERAGAAAVASIADIDGEVIDNVAKIHPRLTKAVSEFRDWHLDGKPVPAEA